MIERSPGVVFPGVVFPGIVFRGVVFRGVVFWRFVRTMVAVLLLGMAGAAAQTGQPAISPVPDQAPRPGAPSPAQAPAQPGPPIDVAEITARANRDAGDDIQATVTGWQRELDRLES